MTYFLYILGLLFWGLAACYLIIISKKDEDELPFPKEVILRVVMILTMIGTIFLTVSKTFMNIQNELDKTYLETNKIFLK